jgi:hypothetical protein
MPIPAPLPLSAFNETMLAASRRASSDLASCRARLKGELPSGQFAMIKTGLAAGVGREYVWVRVTEWPAGEFVGTLEVEPVDAEKFARGQLLRVGDADVFDRAILDAAATPEPNTVVAPANSWSFHAVIWPGCTSNRFANSASVPSFRTAARATFALNAGA